MVFVGCETSEIKTKETSMRPVQQRRRSILLEVVAISLAVGAVFYYTTGDSSQDAVFCMLSAILVLLL